ncbi:MAG: hypothetical protein MAGBODY4_00166 [Candidatus Marinimicrobia bacterium]|nr:hypothetical protein [Candidatus Neomarinimicrobiota bacterium]
MSSCLFSETGQLASIEIHPVQLPLFHVLFIGEKVDLVILLIHADEFRDDPFTLR